MAQEADLKADLKLNPADLYDSDDGTVLRGRVIDGYRINYHQDNFWRVASRVDGKPIPKMLEGSFLEYANLVSRIKAANTQERKD